jgi:hypothetical protein
MYNPESTPPFAEILPVELTAYTGPKWPECTAARGRIESDRSRAREKFLEIRRQDPPATGTHDRYAFLNYIVTVWYSLNHELCVLGRRRKWRHVLPADHIRLRAKQFLENFTIFIAYPEDGRDRYDRPLEGIIEHHLGHSPNLSSSFWKLIEQHELWTTGEAERVETADHQGGKRKAPPASAPAASPEVGIFVAAPASPVGKTGEKGKARKKQAKVTVDPDSLLRELKVLNSNRKPPDKPLELNNPSELAAQLAAESTGGPNKKSWEKMLTGQPVRSDVVRVHLNRFFEEHEHRLQGAIPFQENLSSGPKT